MAGFRMHVSTSTLLGVGYAGVLSLGYGVPPETAVVAGAMCGFSGMLPDIDSDTGVPLRETMAFSAAIVPMMLVSRLQTLCVANGLGHDAVVLAAVAMYLLVRFGVTNMIRKFTVHRGMFHSIPAMLIFVGLAFLVSGGASLEARYYKAGGVMGGFMSHLVLDEIYAVEFAGGRWRLKKSFGTAIKLWGDDRWSNFTTYAKLAIVAMAILGEPSVMQQIEARNPQFAGRIEDIRSRLGSLDPNALPEKGGNVARAAVNYFNGVSGNQFQSQNAVAPTPQYAGAPQPMNSAPAPTNQPAQWQWPAATQTQTPSYDTAQRPSTQWPQ